jgi:hypothetical protein
VPQAAVPGDHPDGGHAFVRGRGAQGTAWLNSSWDIAHDQAPSVSANGATAQEAQDRVFNERYLDGARASTAWWWWRWYDVAASAGREGVHQVPADLRRAVLAPAGARSPAEIGQRFGVDGARARQLLGMVTMETDGRRVHVGDHGVVSARLAEPDRGNRQPLARADAIAAA